MVNGVFHHYFLEDAPANPVGGRGHYNVMAMVTPPPYNLFWTTICFQPGCWDVRHAGSNHKILTLRGDLVSVPPYPLCTYLRRSLTTVDTTHSEDCERYNLM